MRRSRLLSAPNSVAPETSARLATRMADRLAEDRLRRGGYLAPAPVRQAWSALCNDSGQTQSRVPGQVWSVLMFEAWRDA